MNKIKVVSWADLSPLTPTHALVANVDLVIVRWEENVSVLYGRCHHRGALLADGFIDGENLICGVHFWDYRFKTGTRSRPGRRRIPSRTGATNIRARTPTFTARRSSRTSS
jgi:nitrite reductase/ring-hydroxylating ferredoxin subunit